MIVADQIVGMILALTRGFEWAQSWRTVAQPLCLALGVALLWHGENWLRWLVAIACIISGGAKIVVSGYLAYRFLAVTPKDQLGFFVDIVGWRLLVVSVGGLLYVTAGLAFLLAPSLRAFFARQRQPSYLRDAPDHAWSVTVIPDEMPHQEEQRSRPPLE